MNKRIALVGFGHFSLANPSLAEALRGEFEGVEVEWVELGVEVKGLTRSWRNWFEAAREFRDRGGLTPGGLRTRLGWTTHVFEERSRAARRRLAAGGYACTIQTQSHYDARVDGVPHFVYTDNTMLANLQYPELAAAFPAGELPVTGSWIDVERQLYRGAGTCFVMSENVRRSLDRDYGCEPGRIVTAYAGSNLANSSQPVARRPGAILWVGVEWERKGGPELVEAFRQVRGRIPEATLTIVGCAPAIEEPGCTVVGRIAPTELPVYYRQASVFCLPTRHEPFGFVFPEAMAHELPVVATDIGAIPDMVVDGLNGFRVPSGDVAALATALGKVLGDNGARERMGRESRRISETYTWRNTAAIMGETIRRLVPAVRAGAGR